MTVDMRSKHPRTLTCDGMATSTLRACHLYWIITVKDRRDLLQSQEKYTKKEYSEYNDFKKYSKGKHILRRGFEGDIVVFRSMSEQV